MLSLNIFLSLGLLISISLALFVAGKNHHRLKLNNTVADELDSILGSILDVTKKKRLRAEAALVAQNKKNGEDGLQDINSPDMLATLLTVLIYKYGLTRLSISDFKKVSQDEYVSIYVETKTNDLILSLSHDLQDADATMLTTFSSSVDDTFH